MHEPISQEQLLAQLTKMGIPFPKPSAQELAEFETTRAKAHADYEVVREIKEKISKLSEVGLAALAYELEKNEPLMDLISPPEDYISHPE
jgi:hypothetical protein